MQIGEMLLSAKGKDSVTMRTKGSLPIANYLGRNAVSNGWDSDRTKKERKNEKNQ